ncbi:MAG: cation:dicarboxylase symporter family transporter [Clostridiales bacterium]|jgi:L-cystine uptake protein TcyP (sodium:dicarboxylate symporter family)|nr:cation:dicarboxylase symporter family transporter [Clostridiales bacterium]
MDTFIFIDFLIAFAAMLALLFWFKHGLKLGFTARVAIALGLGLILGIGLQLIYGAYDANNKVVLEGNGAQIIKWVDLVGQGFTHILQFIIVPLVAISIISAMTKSAGSKESAKKTGYIVAVLIVTTVFSAVIAILTTRIFNLSADQIIEKGETARAPADVATTFLGLIPDNLFAAFSSNSVLPVVIIAALIGIAYLGIKKYNPSLGHSFEKGVSSVREFVMEIVDFVIELTPYGVLGVIAARAAVGSAASILQLLMFVVASFAAMLVVFLAHLLIFRLTGVGLKNFFKKALPPLLFAFSSRSSAATLPLTIKAQRELGVSEANANLAGTLGTCIGQNACAGVYPTMVALLVAMTQNINVWTPGFLIPLIAFVVIASIGTAGVGGGATNVSLLVLSFLALPIQFAVILVAVDFIIDMGRTLVNVNDGILAGYLTGWFEDDINKDILRNKISLADFEKQAVHAKWEGESI